MWEKCSLILKSIKQRLFLFNENDAIGGKGSEDAQSSYREIHSTLMEMLHQMDGFDELGKVKVIIATN